MVGGMIDLGRPRGRLVSLGHSARDTLKHQHVCILSYWKQVVPLTIMTTQMKVQDASTGTYVPVFSVQSSMCWFFPQS